MSITRKSRRIVIHVEPLTAQLINQAAQILGETRSQFVARSAQERAERSLTRNDAVLISETDFDAFLASLDTPCG
ncbi:MAG: DUF1778 domain-containing protein [Propionibacteriaceae bacterium]|jgi:uncharacterized protein (DUF1778 family)|nr:DUF1778 domain-containing protein [Propionibacteriaceae bacterium]